MGELFNLSVVSHFPPEMYLRRGVGELAPLLVRAMNEKEISALQFLRGGLARVTLRSSAYREELLSSDFMFEDILIPVTPADRQTTSVYLRDLPVEIADDSVRSAFKVFGDIFSVRSTVYKDFPSIRNGTCVQLMSVKQPIPSSLNVLGFVCRTWYPGQPAFCTICRQSGHLPRACAGAVNSLVMWPVSVHRPPVPLLRYRLHLFRLRCLIRPLSPRRQLCFRLYPVSVPVSFPVPTADVVMSTAPRVPPVPQPLDPVDAKKLSRLMLTKVKPGSDVSALTKLAKSLVKSHRLMSPSEIGRIADSILSDF